MEVYFLFCLLFTFFLLSSKKKFTFYFDLCLWSFCLRYYDGVDECELWEWLYMWGVICLSGVAEADRDQLQGAWVVSTGNDQKLSSKKSQD